MGLFQTSVWHSFNLPIIPTSHQYLAWGRQTKPYDQRNLTETMTYLARWQTKVNIGLILVLLKYINFLQMIFQQNLSRLQMNKVSSQLCFSLNLDLR